MLLVTVDLVPIILMSEELCNRYRLLFWFRVSFDTQYVL